MASVYTLQIVCPHCAVITKISDWPRSERTPVLFTCMPTRGGCGGQAYVEPPDVTNFPALEVAIVAATPLTPDQAAYATSTFGPR